MTRILVLHNPKAPLEALVHALQARPEVEIRVAESGAQGLDMAADPGIQLAVVQAELSDMSGLAFLNKLLAVNPMINTALSSSLGHEAFHEATEGLGVLMQLPPKPGEEQADLLLGKLQQVVGLLDR
jgi:DNA-binding NarL/FixJ family response regulator